MKDRASASLEHGWPPGLRALRHRSFRGLWIGLLVSAAGTWMQIVGLSLLVLKLTNGSAFALGCVSLAQACAFFLFALVGGGFADRVNRRRLLMLTQSTLMVIAATIGVLTSIGIITVPLIAGFAFLSGAVLSFDQPARAALIATLVPEEDLLNAISLQSAVFNGAAVAGPALAGLTAGLIGIAANFYFNALSFTAVLFALFSLPAGPAVQRTRERLADQIRAALASVRGDPVLFRALCIYGMLLFAGPSLQLLLPVLAVTRLHVGATALGFLFSAAGGGAVLGALLLGSLLHAKPWVVRAAVACWCLALPATGISSTFQLTFCALLLLGATQSIAGATISALLQTRVPGQQRGRVMSLNTLLIMGVRPLGDFPAGAAIAAMGAPAATVAGALIVASTAAVLFGKRARSL